MDDSRERVVSLLQQEGYEVSTRGRPLFAQCPMHLDRSPSLALYPDHVHCYSCSYNASHWGFVRDWKFPHLVPKGWKEAADLLGVPPLERKPPPPPPRFSPAQQIALATLLGLARRWLQRDREAQAYLAGRGLGQWWRLGWGYVPKRSLVFAQFQATFGHLAGRQLALQLGIAGEWEGVLHPNRLGGRILIPERRAGVALWYQGRSIDPKVSKRFRYLSPPRVTKEFLGFASVGDGPVLLVEGPFDAAPLWLAGRGAIALGGASASPWRLDELAQVLRTHPTLIALDNDDTGREKAPLLQAALRERGVDCRLFQIPEAYKDLSAYLLEHQHATLGFHD